MIIEEKDNYCLLKVFIQPKSSKSCIVGIYGDSLKIKVNSPPVDNAANKECIKILSKVLKTNKGNIEIKEGQKTRKKTVKIGLNLSEIKKALDID